MRVISLSIIAAAAGVSILIINSAQQPQAERASRPTLVAFESPRPSGPDELALPEGLAPAQRISFPPVVVVGNPARARIHTRR